MLCKVLSVGYSNWQMHPTCRGGSVTAGFVQRVHPDRLLYFVGIAACCSRMPCGELHTVWRYGSLSYSPFDRTRVYSKLPCKLSEPSVYSRLISVGFQCHVPACCISDCLCRISVGWCLRKDCIRWFQRNRTIGCHNSLLSRCWRWW